jgi:hypothetical protein
MPEVVPRVPDRRREDPLLRQILELLEVTRATVASMEGRLRVVEREAMTARQMRDETQIADMSREQRSAFIELADWWLDRQQGRRGYGRTVALLVALVTIIQGLVTVIAIIVTRHS